MNKELKELLPIVQRAIGTFLAKYLTQISGDDWWESKVIASLSEHQARLVSEKGISELEQLDLAALLSIFFRNWYDFRNAGRLAHHGQTLAHEIRGIRNRVAHESLVSAPVEDSYRDADSICRFLEFLDAEQHARDSAQAVRKTLAVRLTDSYAEEPDAPDELAPMEDDEVGSSTSLAPGVPVDTFGPKKQSKSLDDALAYATYVGIDFGTSTTVVSLIKPDDGDNGFSSQPMKLKQFSPLGASIEDHIVPSCIAWHNEKLYIGRGAETLKVQQQKDRNIWTSFKMGLGIDLGPTYPHTQLDGSSGSRRITNAQEAAFVYFQFIREQVEVYCQDHGLPERIYYSVSVPAGFQANQRQDLLKILSDAGITTEESALIDEPNAAFLSFMSELTYGKSSKTFLEESARKPKNILVYDFGAGTCDISILQISTDEKRIISKNLAISKFMALGGDDIDLAIANQILLPQLCGGKSPSDCFTVGELEHVVIKTLRYAAEELKISCSKYLQQANIRTTDAKLLDSDRAISARPVAPFKVSGQEWQLFEPSITLRQFSNIMSDFFVTSDESRNLVAPIEDALTKSSLEKNDLSMVIFVGGSSQNTLVQGYIEAHLGRFVECIVPPDLRSLVSQGSAINSFLIHGLGLSLIQPITSESIYIVTRDDTLESILEAGTSVPSPDLMISNFKVSRKSQRTIELPICVGNKDTLIGVITIERKGRDSLFVDGDEVTVSCNMTVNKLIKVRASFKNEGQTETVMANFNQADIASIASTTQSKALMRARQSLNESILAGENRRPSIEALMNFASASQTAGLWQQAAEANIAIEQIDKKQDRATSIAYNYAMCSLYARSDVWSEKAYSRRSNALTAYNMAIAKNRSGCIDEFEALLEESLNHDSDYYPALVSYGQHLQKNGDVRGVTLLKEFCESLESNLRDKTLSANEHSLLRRAADAIGREDMVDQLDSISKPKNSLSDSLYNPDNLVSAKTEVPKLSEGG